jgi:hypothetical protein
MSDRVAAQTQQTADVERRLEMHAHEMTSRMTLRGLVLPLRRECSRDYFL